VIPLDDVDGKTLTEILRYIYTGKCLDRKLHDCIIDCLISAEKYSLFEHRYWNWKIHKTVVRLGMVWNHSRSTVATFYARGLPLETLLPICYWLKDVKTMIWCNIFRNLLPKIFGQSGVVKIGENWLMVLLSWLTRFSTKFWGKITMNARLNIKSRVIFVFINLIFENGQVFYWVLLFNIYILKFSLFRLLKFQTTKCSTWSSHQASTWTNFTLYRVTWTTNCRIWCID